MNSRYVNGMTAGLTAAAASGVVAVVATQTGFAPSFNPPDLLAALLGTAPNAVLGWVAHLLVYGIALGLLFGALGRKLSGLGYGLGGLLFALITFAAAGLLFMPLAGAGVFGMLLSYSTVPVMLVAHMVFGLTLGFVYGRLAGRDRDAPLTPAKYTR